MSYLPVLRLAPLFPFFPVNLVPAFLGVSWRAYVVGTFVGIIPGTFVFAAVGAGLGSVFVQGEEFSVAGILTPQIITALVGLAVLALIPVVYKKFRASSGKAAAWAGTISGGREDGCGHGLNVFRGRRPEVALRGAVVSQAGRWHFELFLPMPVGAILYKIDLIA